MSSQYNGTQLPRLQTSPSRTQRPQHLSTQSIPEISSPPSVQKHQKHHHHPHIPAHHHKKEKDSTNAFPNLQHIITDVGRSVEASESTDVSRDGSRRGSMYVGRDTVDGQLIAGNSSRSAPQFHVERPVREGEVKGEREKSVLRKEELRNSLMDLNTVANNTTRRLDNSYYNVLEKLSVLQNTIGSLKELAGMTRALDEEFKSESQEIVSDVSGQLDGFGGFEAQEKKILDLQQRVERGRQRIKSLGGKVDIVRVKVDGWEQAEHEWQEKTRKRFRMLWIFMSVVVSALVVLALIYWGSHDHAGPDILGHTGGKGLNATGLLGKVPDMQAAKDTTRKKAGEALEALKSSERDAGHADARLRVLDEL